MSWGWIIVIAMGFLPLLLIFLTGGKKKKNNKNATQNDGDDGDELSTIKKAVKNRDNRPPIYTGWRIVISADAFISRITEPIIMDNDESNKQQKNNGENENDDDENDDDDSMIVENIAMRTRERMVIVRTQLSTLQQLAQCCDLYIVAQVSSDEQERAILKSLTAAAEHDSTSTSSSLSLCDCGLNRHKILFCETARGQIAIARQLEPQLFVGTDGGVTSELSRFLPNVSRVTPTCSFVSTTLSSLSSNTGASIGSSGVADGSSSNSNQVKVYNSLNELFDSFSSWKVCRTQQLKLNIIHQNKRSREML